MKKNGLFSLILILAVFMFSGCETSHKIESQHEIQTVHEVKPIHIIIDINLKVDKELDNYFGDLDAAEEKIETKTKSTAK